MDETFAVFEHRLVFFLSLRGSPSDGETKERHIISLRRAQLVIFVLGASLIELSSRYWEMEDEARNKDKSG